MVTTTTSLTMSVLGGSSMSRHDFDDFGVRTQFVVNSESASANEVLPLNPATIAPPGISSRAPMCSTLIQTRGSDPGRSGRRSSCSCRPSIWIERGAAEMGFPIFVNGGRSSLAQVVVAASCIGVHACCPEW